MILLIVTLAIIALIVYRISQEPIYDTPREQKYKHQEKYHIPPQFWEDYNNISTRIYLMRKSDMEKVKYLIDDFESKYSQYIELKVYNERMAILLEQYRTKEFFLTSKYK